MKRGIGVSVLQAARERIRYSFDHFERVYVSFSAGKDSSVMLHLVMEEAIRRGRRVGVLFIDLEAQYELTIKHAEEMLDRGAVLRLQIDDQHANLAAALDRFIHD